MSRLPAAKREDLTPEHQQIWDRIHAARSGGGGPYSMLMHSPAMAQHFAATEDYFRHEIRAQKLGVDPKIIEALRAKAPIDDFTGRERLLIEFTRTLVHDHTVPEPLFARMAREFGRAKFIEAVGLLGHYMTIGTVIRLFEVKVPEGIKTF
jgi:hypothetical protein